MTKAPAYSLPRSVPSRQGVRPEAVLAFLEALESERERLAPHSLMVIKQGHVVASGWWAPYGPAYPHLLNSLSKSFTAAAIGLAADEQLLTLDQRVLSFFSEYATDNVFYDRIVCRFDGDRLHISTSRSVPVAPVLSDMGVLPEMRGTRV